MGTPMPTPDKIDFSKLPIYKPEVECASRERIRAIQLAKLIQQVEYTYCSRSVVSGEDGRDGRFPQRHQNP